MPLKHGYTEVFRGLGLADMAYSMRIGKNHRANGDLASHIVEVINGFFTSAEEGRRFEIASSCERPEPMPQGLTVGSLE